MDFTVTKYEKLTDTISDSTLQLTFTKPPFVTFCVVPKKNNHNYLQRLKKYSSFCQLKCLCGGGFSS